MKLIQLLEQESATIKDHIRHNCAPFLSNSNINLIRGQSLNRATLIQSDEFEFGDDIFEANLYEVIPRTDRKPLSTDRKLSTAVDDWFEKNFSVRPRSTGIFTMPFNDNGIDVASSYGDNMGLVFPIGEYTAVYSTVYDDLFIDLFRQPYYQDGFNPNDPDMLDGFMQAGKYQVGKKIAVDQEKMAGEITVICSKYYLLTIVDEDGDYVSKENVYKHYAKMLQK